jgi:hypothetical protein
MTNTLRKIALVAILAATAGTTMTMTSCKKEEGCPTGYEGTDCKTMINAKFVGSYEGSETCTVGTDNYTISVTSVSADNMQLTINNLYNDAYVLTATITESNKFSISGTSKGVTFTGTGTLSSNVLTVNYTAGNGVTSNSCTFTGTKK